MASHRHARDGSRAVALAAALVLVAVVITATATATSAQERAVRAEGRVQWIAGQTAMLNLDSGGSVGVDLTGVAQDEYAALKQQESIVVTGVMSSDGRRLIATSIARRDETPPRTP
jgi:hypothetical protein